MTAEPDHQDGAHSKDSLDDRHGQGNHGGHGGYDGHGGRWASDNHDRLAPEGAPQPSSVTTQVTGDPQPPSGVKSIPPGVGEAQGEEIEGVIVIDKPAGITSHDVVFRIRKLVGSRPGRKGKRQGPKVGHAGTLDPAATGVLVVCLGRATRLVPWLQAATKTYEATIRLGRTTDTLDDDGIETNQCDASHITREAIEAALGQFIGEIQQIPPMVSAIRIDGERLHEKARRGEVVERQPRNVTIEAITIDAMGQDPYPWVRVTVVCSAGTYIRTLADDLGRALGVGGHLTALRRTKSGQSHVDQAVGLEDLTRDTLADHLLSPVEAISFMPHITLDDELVERLRNGQRPRAQGLETDTVVLDQSGGLVGIVHEVGRQMISKLIVH